MPEINSDAGLANVPDATSEPSRDDAPFTPLDDDLDLEVIERLAEEETSQPMVDLMSASQTAQALVVTSPQPAVTIDTAAVVSSIDRLAEHLGGRLDLLQTTFERELRAEATRERVVDRLHAELQEYKQDFLLKIQRPIFIDLIQLHDDIGKMIEAGALALLPTDEPARLPGPLESIQTAIEDILYRQGVEPFTIPDTEFDPRKQRAVSTRATEDKDLNKRVAARLRKGFCSGERLIRPEIVTVFTYRPPQAVGTE